MRWVQTSDVLEYLKEHPHATRKELIAEFGTQDIRYHLHKLEKAGLARQKYKMLMPYKIMRMEGVEIL